MSSDQLESVMHENRTFPPNPDFVARARVNAQRLAALNESAAADHVGFWGQLARTEISWQKPFSVVLDDSKAPNYGWFTDGTLNVSWSCLDRHLEKRGNKVAIIAEGEKGDVRRLTERQGAGLDRPQPEHQALADGIRRCGAN